MSLYIRSEECDRLARELAWRTGETITEAVAQSLRERLDRTPEPVPATPSEKMARILEIARRSAALPEIEAASEDELMYDALGLPK